MRSETVRNGGLTLASALLLVSCGVDRLHGYVVDMIAIVHLIRCKVLQGSDILFADATRTRRAHDQRTTHQNDPSALRTDTPDEQSQRAAYEGRPRLDCHRDVQNDKGFGEAEASKIDFNTCPKRYLGGSLTISTVEPRIVLLFQDSVGWFRFI
jgi:hypothetical protein